MSAVREINHDAIDEGEATEGFSRARLVDRVFGKMPLESVGYL